MEKIKKFLKSESRFSTFLAGATLGFISGINWKGDNGQIDWWLTITFLLVLISASSFYWRNDKGRK